MSREIGMGVRKGEEEYVREEWEVGRWLRRTLVAGWAREAKERIDWVLTPSAEPNEHRFDFHNPPAVLPYSLLFLYRISDVISPPPPLSPPPSSSSPSDSLLLVVLIFDIDSKGIVSRSPPLPLLFSSTGVASAETSGSSGSPPPPPGGVEWRSEKSGGESGAPPSMLPNLASPATVAMTCSVSGVSTSTEMLRTERDSSLDMVLDEDTAWEA